VVLALAWLALCRPGWDDFLRSIDVQLDPDAAMYEAMKRANADQVPAWCGSLRSQHAKLKQQAEERAHQQPRREAHGHREKHGCEMPHTGSPSSDAQRVAIAAVQNFHAHSDFLLSCFRAFPLVTNAHANSMHPATMIPVRHE
jgi:hypothetical protein